MTFSYSVICLRYDLLLYRMVYSSWWCIASAKVRQTMRVQLSTDTFYSGSIESRLFRRCTQDARDMCLWIINGDLSITIVAGSEIISPGWVNMLVFGPLFGYPAQAFCFSQDWAIFDSWHTPLPIPCASSSRFHAAEGIEMGVQCERIRRKVGGPKLSGEARRPQSCPPSFVWFK